MPAPPIMAIEIRRRQQELSVGVLSLTNKRYHMPPASRRRPVRSLHSFRCTYLESLVEKGVLKSSTTEYLGTLPNFPKKKTPSNRSP